MDTRNPLELLGFFEIVPRTGFYPIHRTPLVFNLLLLAVDNVLSTALSTLSDTKKPTDMRISVG